MELYYGKKGILNYFNNKEGTVREEGKVESENIYFKVYLFVNSVISDLFTISKPYFSGGSCPFFNLKANCKMNKF